MQVKDVFGNLPTLETDRLLLRRIEPGDLEDIFEYASDPEVAKYCTWEAHSSLEESTDFLKSVLDRYENGEVAPWGIVHKADGKLVGTCSFLGWSIRDARAEIGFALSRKYWGCGLMTEAVREIISFGFREMKLNRIQGNCEVENAASARVMEKAGMKLEGVLRETQFLKGRWVSVCMYSILKKEWGG